MADTLVTEFGFSYEYGVDIYIPGDGDTDGVWQKFRFPTGIALPGTPTLVDADTYDDLGSPRQVKIGESWSGTFSVQEHRLADGSYLPEVEQLMVLAGPDTVGNKAVGLFRWYDKPAVGVPNPRDAYEGNATVELTRGATDNQGIGSWNVTLTGQGRRRQIENPWTGWDSEED